jgi:hypothetical protein
VCNREAVLVAATLDIVLRAVVQAAVVVVAIVGVAAALVAVPAAVPRNLHGKDGLANQGNQPRYTTILIIAQIRSLPVTSVITIA